MRYLILQLITIENRHYLLKKIPSVPCTLHGFKRIRGQFNYCIFLFIIFFCYYQFIKQGLKLESMEWASFVAGIELVMQNMPSGD